VVVRLGLDFLIAGLIIFAVTIIRRRSPDPSWTSKQALFVYVAVLVVLIAGWQLVTWAGILWLDFLLVALALLLHPKTEHFVDHLLEKLRKHPAPVVKTACVILSFMAMSGELSAQERLFLPAPCAENVAAVGLQLTKPKPTPKRKVVGTCYWGSNRQGPWNQLTADDVKRQYYSGQYLACDAECSVTLYFCGSRTQEAIGHRRADPYPIIHVYSRPPVWQDTRRDNLLRQARVFSPADPGLTNEPPPSIVGYKVSPIPPGAVSAITYPSTSANRKPSATGVKPSDLPDKPQAVGAAVGIPLAAGMWPSPALAQFLEALSKGNTARQKKDYAVARKHYLTAQGLRPDDQRGYQGLANVFADEKNWSAAAEAYREALKRPAPSPNSQLHVSLAFVLLQPMMANHDYAKVNEVEEQLRLATRTLPVDEGAYDLYEQLVEVKARDLRQAEDFFVHAVLFAPASPTAFLRLANVLYLRDKSEEAFSYAQRAEKYAVGEQLLEVASFYQAHGRYEDAERVWQTALKTMPKNPAVLYNLGSVLLQRRRFRSAHDTLQKAVELQPSAFAPALAYGIARFRRGDLANAERSWDEASRKVGENADGLQRLAYWFSALGDAYSAQGKISDAVRAYEKSVTHAENAEVRARLLKMKQKRDAVQKRNAGSP
jgi:tetratricopeptide (TPR) repeat protein